MQYLGGKKRIAKQLCAFLNEEIKKGKYDYYLEPFVGSCAIIENIVGIKKYASDKNEYLIELYKSLQNGWMPPKNLSEEEYDYIKNHKEEDMSLTTFAGIGCSYSGKWFGGYSRNKKGRNYALNAHNSLIELVPKILDVEFLNRDYLTLSPKNALIYCDPPYINTTKYDLFKYFDHEKFWNTMEIWSEYNKVFISEYTAPDNFECIMSIDTKTSLRDKEGNVIPRTERLFTIKG